MSIIKQISVIQHQTTDGRMFSCLNEAREHQVKIDIITAVCETDLVISYKTDVQDLDNDDIATLVKVGKILQEAGVI